MNTLITITSKFIIVIQMQSEQMDKKQKDFKLGGITLSSNFESGNIGQASLAQDNFINLWIEADPAGNYKTWFYFSVEGVQQGATVTFAIMNMSNQVKLFKEGHQPVFKTDSSGWRRLKAPLAANAVVKVEAGYQVTFKHTFTQHSKHYFAFSYPWTTLENDQLIQSLKENIKQNVYCSYDELCLSYRKRPVMLLTLTKPKTGEEPQILQGANGRDIITFKGKKGIFISARVHPGEVAASHMMNGILRFLFSNSKEADILLENFAFYIVPIINPDGVAEGNFRTDSQGKNLNRFYTNPDPQGQPQIFGIKSFLVRMIKEQKIDFCLDLHAHVNKQGAFIYGNSVAGDLKGQTDVCLFPKLLSFHNQIFDYDGCNFSEKNMCSKDKGDDLSKQGASRVAIFKETGLARCWTLQCNYNSTKITHVLPKPTTEITNNSVSNVVLTSKVGPDQKEEQRLLNFCDFQRIGIDICEAILDFYSLRDTSRVFGSKLKNMNNVKLNTAVAALRLIPFRFDAECRKLLNNINSSIQVKESLSRISKLIKLENEPPNQLQFKNLSVEERVKSEKEVRTRRQYSIKKFVSKEKNQTSTNTGAKNPSKRIVHSNTSVEETKKSAGRPSIPLPSRNAKKSSLIPLLK